MRPSSLADIVGNARALNPEEIIDLSDTMSQSGQLDWDAPEGHWLVVRLGYASNFKMTRPVPSHLVGLECDRLHPRGVEAHFEHWLKPILEGAGEKAGRTLKYIHVDSWEADGQNWTTDFHEEFLRRRGYEISPWLPVLTGQMVDSREKTERFFWDMRQTVSEMHLDNYFRRLKELIEPYGVSFSSEPYGRLCVNNLSYAAISDFPIAEFWTRGGNPSYRTRWGDPPFIVKLPETIPHLPMNGMKQCMHWLP